MVISHAKNLPAVNKKIRVAFHGTKPSNIEKIAQNGLLKVGNPKNPSKAVDSGMVDTPQSLNFILLQKQT